MAAVTLLPSSLVGHLVDGRPGAVLSLLAGCVAGLLTFGLTQRLCRSQEAAWLTASISSRPPTSLGASTIKT
jgi:hypothetical protein